MTKLSVVPSRTPAAPSNDLTLDAIRAEIDGVDDEILQLIQHRQRLAARIGEIKDAAGEGPAPGLKLRPDREASVISRRVARAQPGCKRLAQALWRELMSAGLSVQQQLEVVVWSGPRRDARDAARARFGGSADYRDARSAADALEAALKDDTIAVLALDPDDAWWAELLDRPDLWVFEGLGRRGPSDPAALAVGRVNAANLARGGVTYRISTGGDSGTDHRAERVISVSEGRRLCVSRDLGSGPLDREHGVVGTAAGV